MRRESSPHHAGQAPIAARTAWWIAIVATLTLALGLAAAHSARAAAPAAPGGFATTGVALPPVEPEEPADEATEEGEEAEELELEECEVFEDEGEEEEICEEEDTGGIPAECLLASSTATVSASPGSDRVRLAIRYTTSSPAAVEVEFFLRGRKGPLSFDDQRQRFGHAGVFHASAALTEAQMEKVLAAKSFRVQLHALSAPRSCDRYFDRNLSVRHASGRALTWSDPEASPRRGRRTA